MSFLQRDWYYWFLQSSWEMVFSILWDALKSSEIFLIGCEFGCWARYRLTSDVITGGCNNDSNNVPKVLWNAYVSAESQEPRTSVIFLDSGRYFTQDSYQKEMKKNREYWNHHEINFMSHGLFISCLCSSSHSNETQCIESSSTIKGDHEALSLKRPAFPMNTYAWFLQVEHSVQLSWQLPCPAHHGSYISSPIGQPLILAASVPHNSTCSQAQLRWHGPTSTHMLSASAFLHSSVAHKCEGVLMSGGNPKQRGIGTSG